MSPFLLALAGSLGSVPELATTLPAASLQVIVDFVPPDASDWAWAEISVSGVSVAEKVASFPSPHVEFLETLTS